MIALAAVLVIVTVAFALEFSAQRGGTHPFSVHDLVDMERISDALASPDGAHIVFTRRITDLEANRGRNDLWLVGADGRGLRRLTRHPGGSHSPRWAPDGRWIYFLSTRDDSTQVWKISVDGGEAEPVTKLPVDVGSFVVAPSGKHLAVSLEVFPKTTLAETKQRLDELKQRQATGQLYDRLFVRHWDTWKDGRRAHLFVIPTANGQPVDVMKRMDADAPPKPFGGAEEFTFTPDSRSLIFAARDVGRCEAWSTHFDLFSAPVDGSAPPRVVVPGNGAILSHPTFSPDGKTLAFLATARPGCESDRMRIVLKPWRTGPARVLTERWDRSAHKIVWSPDGQTIYTHADSLGHHPLFAVNVQTGKVRTLVPDGRVTEITIASDRVVYGSCHHRSPVELYTIAPNGGRPRPITRVNAAKLATVRLGEPEQFTFQGWNDETVYGYVMTPADFNARKKYPVAFLIHGGPEGSFGSDFHYRWNPQTYAGAGYAVVSIDFHGSTGYGQAFTDSINGHWGDRPLEDLQKGLAFALARYRWLDEKRMAALGASFGGYMINWLHGVWPRRFRCLVCHDGNIDERMAYYDTEELWFPEWERGGTPWDQPAAYVPHNPIDFVHKWRTPTLVIHGGRDFRVVDTQGLSTFTALQRRGIPSKFLYFPDENHWVLKPANSIQWHETVTAWLDQWCKK